MARILSLFLSLLFLAMISSFSSSSHPRRHKATASSALSTPEIHDACKASRFPESCEQRLSNSIPSLPPGADSAQIIAAVFNSSLSNLQTARSTAKAILDASAADRNRTNAARNCIELLSYSENRLSAATSSPNISSPDARAWASAALLYQYDCWSALTYVNGTSQVADATAFMFDLINRTSDGLSMLAALQRYGGDTAKWAPPQTERDGYWAPVEEPAGGAGAGGSPFGDDAPDVTVCKAGGCDYRTVQAAVDSAPANLRTGRFVIGIKEGVYDEIVRVPFEKTNLVFVGNGMGRTVITGNLSADVVGVNTYNTATVAVAGDGFMARELTFRNTAGPTAHQAVAFRSSADLTVLHTVELSGHQDTLYAHSLRQYYKSCVISGTVDFIFGNSAAVFESCLILIVPHPFNPKKGESDTVTAHGRTDPAQFTGFVFHGCNVNATEDYWKLYKEEAWAHRVYLGRPWKEFSRTVFLECYLEAILRPEGWMPWSGDFALKTLYYGEFQNTGPGANLTARVPWSSQIPAEHAGAYSTDNFIQGNLWIPAANY
ncbi:putative pectinesterase/pectinesterase inhibitor 51 [Apostasia shenzhenica]|uniref:Pectinesterase n=1 Tax=Apostasia shenzhenica TaxID=1088818 RepID=A0A2I0A425_9ASPA|nr:putative pectinesterase/pectinesterase inhibitor 51 [Apostasia shenzhenica]